MMPARTIVLGDIHGCATALRTILTALDPQLDDLIVTLGDYVDRGTNSRDVLDQLVALVERCRLIPLLGNHEIMLLDSFENPDTYDFWQHCGGDMTLASYDWNLENIPTDHLVFLRHLHPFFETPSHLFVHANYHPELPLAETPEMLLYWEHINQMPIPHRSGKTVIVGHTPQPSGQILNLDFLLCVDTYCFGGGWLTALDVDRGETWQANELGELRTGRIEVRR
jgi:serine/threonine protein phosphatase 1